MINRKKWCCALAAALAMWIAPTAFAQVRLFTPAAAQNSVVSAVPANARRTVALETSAMRAMRPGNQAILTSPSGVDYVVVHDRTEIGYAGGSIWVGHLRDYPSDRPVIISTYDGRVSGSIDIPGSKLRLEGSEQQALLTDIDAAGEVPFQPSIDDIARPFKDPFADVAASLALPSAPAPTTAAANSQIDLLFLYSPNMSTQLGGFSGVVARANALVSTANSIYGNSAMSVTLNLVEVQLLNASYADSDDFTTLGSSTSGLTGDASVAALRKQYGADLVTLMRPFVGNICGLAWITNGSAGSSSYGYSVFEDGSSGGFYCDNSSMTHELGHNMGAAHDVGTTVANTPQGQSPDVNGLPAYNRGYCNGNAGTIMAYTSTSGCSPLAYFFSNPNLTTQCGGATCGVDKNTQYTVGSTTVTGADSVTAINANAVSIATWRSPPNKFVSLTPARLLDTRAGATTFDGTYVGTGALGPGESRDLPVIGRGGVPYNVPDSTVGSVVLNVTVANPTAASHLTVWPAGGALPLASNLNFTPGQIIPNLVIAKVGNGGAVSMFNSAGSTDVIADVAGWFPTSSAFTALNPARLLDTRPGQTTADGLFAGGGALGPGTTLNLNVLNRGGVPPNGVGAVVLNVTVTNPTAAGHITAWPAGSSRPNTSNLNFTAGLTIPNLVVSQVGTSGQVSLYNSAGNTHLIADVAGWFASPSELTSVAPARLLDTRAGSQTVDGQFQGGGALGVHTTLNLTVTNRAGIPASGVGTVVLNVTAVTPTAAGYLTVWGAGDTRPNASNLNFTPGLVIPNLVFAKVGSNGQVSIYNNAGSTDVIADVVGWMP